jgi:lysophospholipase L1-like esterase
LFPPSLRLTLLAATLTIAVTPLLAQSHWIATWGTAAVPEVNTQHAYTLPTTLRQIVHVSIGGSTLRVVFTNELGVDSLNINDAAVALPAAAPNASGAIQPNTSVPLTFNGHPAITIPPGAVAVSDPVTLTLPPLSNLAISLCLPGQAIPTITRHDLALQTSYEASGDQVSATTLTGASTNSVNSFLKDVEVEAPHGASIVAFGDSITDGWRSTSGANTTWPDILADRLHANPSTRDLGIINEGISGNRVLHDGWGTNALARFDRDVLAPGSVKYLIILESINDIGAAQNPINPHDPVTADDLITGLSQLATRAHTHGIKVYGATITPYLGAKYASPAGEAIRQAVNQWIRTTHQLDGVIDFDKATSDPAHPTVFAPAFDSDDHLHPNDAGYKAMGDAIDLNLFTK